MSIYALLHLMPMLALLTVAAAIDLRTRRIPNWLTVLLLMSGLAKSALPASQLTILQALSGMLIGFCLPLALFILGALGGGDVKLLSGIGAWLGPLGIVEVFAIAAIIAMVMVLVHSARQGRLALLLRNTALVTLNVMNAHRGAVQSVLENSRTDGPAASSALPYAVPLLMAVLVVCAVT
jgi:Flp pilus assembly protein protease CpaA